MEEFNIDKLMKEIDIAKSRLREKGKDENLAYVYLGTFIYNFLHEHLTKEDMKRLSEVINNTIKEKTPENAFEQAFKRED